MVLISCRSLLGSILKDVPFLFCITLSNMKLGSCVHGFGEANWYYCRCLFDEFPVRALTLRNLVLDDSMVDFHNFTQRENNNVQDFPYHFSYDLLLGFVICFGIMIRSIWVLICRVCIIVRDYCLKDISDNFVIDL